MLNKINNLIVDIGNTLAKYAEGTIPFENAKKEYQRLLAKYEKIAGKLKSENTRNIEGLCYYSNSENFSLLSGIYRTEGKDIYPLAYYGDESLSRAAMNILAEKSDELKAGCILKISPNVDEIFSHDIYAYLLSYGRSGKTIFASVSSSPYFSEDKFLFIGKLLKNILNIFKDEDNAYKNNYFLLTSNEIKEYMKENIDEYHAVRINLFVFNSVEKVFSHMGQSALMEISEYIFNALKKNYKLNSRSITLSIKDYIVLEKIDRNDLNKTTGKIDFSFKGINLPHQTLRINMEKEESMYTVWDKILTFENYVLNGDIIR